LHYFNQIREKRKLNKNITDAYMTVVRGSLSK
jgi:hypothetical protein